MKNEIILLTAASEAYWPLMRLSSPGKLEYCLRWQVDLCIRKHINYEPWGERTVYMQQALPYCDWLWFMGADTLIMNHTVDVRQFLDDSYDLIIAKDPLRINNDVFFLQNNTRSSVFLQKVFELRSEFPNDQEAMEKVIETSQLKVKYEPQKLFNSYLQAEYGRPEWEGNFTDGDFILHLPGMNNERRIQLMTEYLPRVIK